RLGSHAASTGRLLAGDARAPGRARDRFDDVAGRLVLGHASDIRLRHDPDELVLADDDRNPSHLGLSHRLERVIQIVVGRHGADAMSTTLVLSASRPRPTARMAMSRSVTIPTRRVDSSTIGSEPTSSSSISCAASRMVVWRMIARGRSVITSAILVPMFASSFE